MTSPTGLCLHTCTTAHLHPHLHLARKSCHNLGNWLAEVTRAESGSGKPAAEAWDQANLSVTDIGEVTNTCPVDFFFII